MSDRPDPREIVDAMANYGVVMNAMVRHAADIAHARRSLYKAYLSEGFTEAQALELCKVLAL